MDMSERAIEYAETYGIIDYKVIGTKMVYYANYPAVQYEKRRTYKVTVDLNSMKECSRECLKRWNCKGNSNMYM